MHTLLSAGIVTTWFHRGAAYVSLAYEQVLNPFCRVEIYARGGEQYGIGDPLWDRGNITWAPRLGGKRIKTHSCTVFDYNHFFQWVKDKALDLIIFNEETDYRLLDLARRHGITIGAYVDYYTPETVPLFNGYDFLLCNTLRHYSVFKDHAGCIYIPWGTDIDLFRPPAARPNALTFFHSAGMSPLRKGTDLILTAFTALAGPAALVIHSQCDLNQCGIDPRLLDDPRISVLTETVGPPGLYSLGSVYLYPSRLDGIGLTLCEALACGLPVVTTDCAPMNEFVTDGANGRLVRVKRHQTRSDSYYWPLALPDEEHLREIMEELAASPEEVSRMGLRARQHAVEHLDWRKNAACLPGRLASLPRTRFRRPHVLSRSLWSVQSSLARTRQAVRQVSRSLSI